LLGIGSELPDLEFLLMEQVLQEEELPLGKGHDRHHLLQTLAGCHPPVCPRKGTGYTAFVSVGKRGTPGAPATTGRHRACRTGFLGPAPPCRFPRGREPGTGSRPSHGTPRAGGPAAPARGEPSHTGDRAARGTARSRDGRWSPAPPSPPPELPTGPP